MAKISGKKPSSPPRASRLPAPAAKSSPKAKNTTPVILAKGVTKSTRAANKTPATTKKREEKVKPVNGRISKVIAPAREADARSQPPKITAPAKMSASAKKPIPAKASVPAKASIPAKLPDSVAAAGRDSLPSLLSKKNGSKVSIPASSTAANTGAVQPTAPKAADRNVAPVAVSKSKAPASTPETSARPSPAIANSGKNGATPLSSSRESAKAPSTASAAKSSAHASGPVSGSAPANGKPRKPNAGFSTREIDIFRDLLLAKRRELLGDVHSMELEALRAGGGSNLSNLPIHMADMGTDNYEQEFTLGLVQKDRDLLKEINLALSKLQNGTYGLCEGSGEPINKERLEYQPWARYSVEHQRKLERHGR